jgi:hypothetical protein
VNAQFLRVQEMLVELLVNPGAYQSFVSDPDAFGRQFGLDADAREKLRGFRPTEISTFREIVAGTRALRFAELLPRLRRHLGGNWADYITRFFDSVAIRDSRYENDTCLFVEFVESQCSDDRIVQCARLELAILLLSDEGAARAHGGLLDLVLDYELQSLLSEDLEDVQPAPRACYRLSRNSDSGEIDVFRLEPGVHDH